MTLFRDVAPRGRQIGRHLKLTISSELFHTKAYFCSTEYSLEDSG